MIRIVQSVCTFVSIKYHFGKSRLNSQRAPAHPTWRNLIFEYASLNKVKFG